VDPSTGKIDVSILTTGISGAVRKQRAERAQTLLELIKTKGKVLVLKYNKMFEEFREKIIEKGEQVSAVHYSDRHSCQRVAYSELSSSDVNKTKFLRPRPK